MDNVTLHLFYSCSSKLLIRDFIFSVCPAAAPEYFLILFISPSSRCQKSSSAGSAAFSFPRGQVCVYLQQSQAHLPMDAWSSGMLWALCQHSLVSLGHQGWQASSHWKWHLRIYIFFFVWEYFLSLVCTCKKFRCSLIFLPNSLSKFVFVVLKY